MQDGEVTGASPADEAVSAPLAVPPARRSNAKPMLLAVLLAFLVGGGLAGWLVWRGDLDAVLPESGREQPQAGAGESPAGSASAPTARAVTSGTNAEIGGVETRLALLEERFSRIDQQAEAASANAARAEALLIALAARRLTDKGQPLGFVEYQLKLRFGSAQPEAVKTIIDASRNPVTLYLLSSQLAASAPEISGERRNESAWERVSREVTSLFVVRRTSSPVAKPLDRAERAQVLLKAGQIDEAIDEVEHLPGALAARDWVAAARRYAETQRALDVVETAAMLEPRALHDATGLAVDRPSPLAPPADRAAQGN